MHSVPSPSASKPQISDYTRIRARSIRFLILLTAILALASSYLDKPIGAQVAAIGEVGLTGELRNVNNLSQRLSEVRRLGFTECIIPKQHGNRLGRPDGLKLTEVQNVGEALRVLARS